LPNELRASRFILDKACSPRYVVYHQLTGGATRFLVPSGKMTLMERRDISCFSRQTGFSGGLSVPSAGGRVDMRKR
jgi:hypothetical protein